jgi:5-methylcytosine-specific restriction endonuclease McrA
MLQTISKKTARILGLRRFFTGKPHLCGHVGERYVSNGGCVLCISDGYSKWRETNLERDRARGRRWAELHRERAKERTRAWQIANPDEAATLSRNWKARKRNADGSHSVEDIELIRLQQKDKCVYCMKELSGKGEVDHIIALSRGGTNYPANLQLVCRCCNASKNARDHIEFAKSLGDL